jgi:hypothetical protein
MAQDITSFFERAATRDFSRDILFRVLGINIAGLSITEDDLVYARSGSIPSRNIQNQTAPYGGLAFQVPGTVQYEGAEAYTISFYCDANSDIHTKMFRETERVFGNDGTGDFNIGGPDDIISLAQLDKNLSPIKTYKLIGASIRSSGNLEYNIAEGAGAVVNFNSTFAYHYYTIE